MKLRQLICVFFLFALLEAAASEPPVGQWRLNEDRGTVAHDAAGENDGLIHGAQWSGGTLNFQVSGDYVEIPDHTRLKIAGQITIALWVRATNFDAPLVNKMPSGQAVLWAPGHFEFRTETGGWLGFLHQTDVRGGSSKYRSESRIAAGRWHHVAVTLVEDKDVVFYLDGKPAGSARQAGQFGIFNEEPVRVGGRKDPYSWFHGRMSDLRIYDTALRADEMEKVAAESRPQEPQPVAATPAVEAASAATPPSGTADWQWPQFRGPDRDGRSKERGLLQSWPSQGPRLLWHAEGLGHGYSSGSIADGSIYTTGTVEEQEWLFALDLQGRLRWKAPYGPAWNGPYPEARTTPTVNEGYVYVISGRGRVCCFDTRRGQRHALGSPGHLRRSFVSSPRGDSAGV